ncbi:hypothetical protein PFISCL1PPCAC_27736, partial [Pristionchus fissidentatus]
MIRFVFLVLACNLTLASARIGGGKHNCTEFEEWKKCATCEPACDNKDPMCFPTCYPSRCMCRPGLYRNNEGKCVTLTECDTAKPAPLPTLIHPICKKNEQFKECSTLCEAKCGEPEPLFCIRMCGDPACQCSEGFYRNSEGECVSRADCENKKPTPSPVPKQPECKKNEQFNQCATMCEAKCGEPEPLFCIRMCGDPACQCSEGFYRNSDGECVSRADCEANLST